MLRAIRESGVCFPDVAAAISAIETGWWFGEDRMMRINNLFGMKASSRRFFYLSLTNDGYCHYRDVLDSLADYRAYEYQVMRKYGLRTESEYLAHICRRFNPKPEFKTKLNAALRVMREQA